MIRIVADDKIPFLKGVLEPYATITYVPGNEIIRSNVKEADALLVRTRTKCNADLLSDTPVKFIGTSTIGFDHIDTQFCEENNIKWTNAPGCNSSSVQQYMVAALLRISKEWDFDLKDKTIGIIGVGNVGSKVTKVAEAFGMKVILNDPPRQRDEGSSIFSDLDYLLSASDIVTLHVPLNMDGEDRTFHLINNDTLSKIKNGSWLINTSRGEVVDTIALKSALATNKLSGTVVDVWEREPEIDTSLMHQAFLATPHIAGYSADGKANGTAMIVNSLCKMFDISLSDWYPPDLPNVPNPDIKIDCLGKWDHEILHKAISHAYNIIEDDIRLRFDPSRFEHERENYPVRREFPFYTVNLKYGNNYIENLLKELGFKVTNTNS
jgi:erythronate-4-phosphate dehydrogenase